MRAVTPGSGSEESSALTYPKTERRQHFMSFKKKQKTRHYNFYFFFIQRHLTSGAVCEGEVKGHKHGCREGEEGISC